MFGIGKLFGNLAGGLLDKIGLGGIAPFVKLGLSAVTGDWLGVAENVFNLVSGFKGNFLNQAAKQPPLGGFEQAANLFAPEKSPLSGNRISQLFKGLGKLFNGLKALTGGGGGNGLGGFGKIFNAFKTISEAFDNNQLINTRLSTSQFTNIRL